MKEWIIVLKMKINFKFRYSTVVFKTTISKTMCYVHVYQFCWIVNEQKNYLRSEIFLCGFGAEFS